MGVSRILLEFVVTMLSHEPEDRDEVHARSAFYRAHHAGCRTAGGAWRERPTTNKALMMANFSTFNTVGITTEEALACSCAAEEGRDFTPDGPRLHHPHVVRASGNRGLFAYFDLARPFDAGLEPTVLVGP